MSARGLHRCLCLLFVGLAACAHLVAAAPAGTRGVTHLALHGALTAVMLAAWATAQRGGEARWTLAAGIAVHVLLFPVPPYTTHDVTRYLADGAVAVAGMDPYRVSPAAAALAGWPQPLDNPSVVTIYPPLALASFALAALAGPALAPWLWKALVLLAVAGALIVCARVLRARGVLGHLPLLALSPLLVLEAGVGAHVDTLATAWLVVGLATAARPAWAGLAWSLAFLCKPQVGGAIGPLALSSPWRSAALGLVSAAVATGAAYALALAIGLWPLGSLPLFVEKWRFGSPLFELARAALGETSALWLALGVAGVGLAALCLMARRLGPERAALWGLSLPLLVSPVVFPWYLLPLVPLVALRPTAFHLAWLSLLPLTHQVIDRFDLGSGWEPARWPLCLLGAGWIAGLALDLVIARRRARRVRALCLLPRARDLPS